MNRVCARCVMDNSSDKSISFDSNGHCSYCTDALARMGATYYPNAVGKAKLNDLLGQIKKDGKGKDLIASWGCPAGLTHLIWHILGQRNGD